MSNTSNSNTSNTDMSLAPEATQARLTKEELKTHLRFLQSALDVQDAVNASGIALALHELYAHLLRSNYGTTRAKQHPAATMFLIKLSELNGWENSLHEAYDMAEIAVVTEIELTKEKLAKLESAGV